nr:CsgG/HfaB family protein [Pseudokordiimonas caeni]
MIRKTMGPVAAVFATVAMLFTPSAVLAKDVQKTKAEKTAQIPHCDKKLGALAVVEPENQWWRQYELGSPEALIKVFVMKSGCFTLVDRGKGMAALQAERALASGGDLRRGSNIGAGQMKAADYVLVPDLVSSNASAGGNAIGGLVGGLLGGRTVGALAGGISIKKKTANVVLTVTDVRSSEQVAMVEGHAKKKDLGWGAGGGLFSGGFLGAAGASGYENTEIGQVITLAYLQAYTDLVSQFSALPDNASEENFSQAVNMVKPGRMYSAADPSSAVVRPVEPGMMLYPTGNKEGVMWEVEDELGNKGWVSSILFELAK